MYPPIDPMSSPWAYSGATPPMPGRQPWMQPGIYSPGQVAFNSNPGMSQLISMLSPPVLSNFAGPNTFIPHMTPSMSNADQIRMSNFQKQRFQSAYDVSQDNNSNVSDLFLGMTKMASDTMAQNPLTQEHASFAARIANDPAAKMIASQIMGADNVEAALHGSKGDISALNSKTSQMAYYMTDPSGVGRMGADAMSAYSRGVYSHLYEPDIDVEKEKEAARSPDSAKRSQAKQRLKRAADTQDEIIDDSEIVDRLVADATSSKKTADLYTKYVSGGKETDPRKQAEALVQYDRAIKESGVLTADEMSVSQAGSAAEKKAVASNRGFLAGQVGQLTEYLQQTGQVGSAIGTKSLEERVAAVAELDVSDATYSRMGRELAKKRLSDTNNQSDEAVKYRSLTTQKEREEFIRDNSGQYEQEVRDTKAQAEKAAKGGKGAPKLEDVEKLGGFQNLAVDVDAEKTAKSVKGYLDAVAAVRDIFGDNGNPNAPMPQLIDALNKLTGSAGAQMSGQKVATQLRQMQTAAKETGVGQEELIALTMQSQNQAKALGLTDADAMRGVTGSLLARKVMTETGAFSTPSYGEYNAQQAQQLSLDLQQRGQASVTNKSLTAMVAMYESSPEAYKGTALEAAVQSYKDGSMEYVDPETGEKVNFAEEVAKNGQAAVTDLGYKAQSTGANKNRTAEEVERGKRRFARRYATELNVTENQELTNDTSVRRVQSEAVEDRSERSMAVTVNQELGELGTFERLGIKDDKQKMAASKSISAKVEARAREAEKLPREEQAAYMQKNIEEDIREGLIAEGVDPKVAAKEAKRLATDREAFGEGGDLSGQLFSQGRATTSTGTGELRKNMDKVIGKDSVNRQAEAAKESEARAITDDKLAQGFETTPLQRLNDYYRSLNTNNENFTASGFMEAIAPGREFGEILRTIDTDMAKTFEQSEARAKAAYVDEEEINTAVAAARGGNTTELRKLAKVSDDTTVVSDEEASQRLLKSLEGQSDDELFALNTEYGSKKFKREEIAENRDEVIARLHGDNRYFKKAVGGVMGEKETTVTQMHEAANKRLGEAADGVTEDEKKEILEREAAIQKAVISGDPEATKEATFQIAKLAEEGMTPSTMQKMTGRKPKMSAAQRKELDALVTGKETTKEDIEKFADTLGLKGDAREQFVTATAGAQASQEMGGFAGSYGIGKDGMKGDPKLVDPVADRKLPAKTDKKAEKEAVATATEAKKLEAAGVVSAETAKAVAEKAATDKTVPAPEKENAGQTEQVSVLKDILSAIRALGGDPAEKAGAAAAEPLVTEENIRRVQEEGVKAAREATEKSLAEEPSAAVKKSDAVPTSDEPAGFWSSLFGAKKPKTDSASPEKSEVVRETDASMADAVRAGVEIPPADVRTGFFSRVFSEKAGVKKPEVEVTTLGDLIKPPAKDVGTDLPAVPSGVTTVQTAAGAENATREFRDYPRSALQTLTGFSRAEDLSGVQLDPDMKSVTSKRIPAVDGMDFSAGQPRNISGLFTPGETGRTTLNLGSDAGADIRRAGQDFKGGILAQPLPNPQSTSGLLVKEDRVVNPKPEPNPQQNQKMEITGRLTLDGLQEVILAAAGDSAVPTGGAPIVPG